MPNRLSYSDCLQILVNCSPGQFWQPPRPPQMAFNLSLRFILLLRVSSSLFSYILTCSNLTFRFDLPYFIYNVCEVVTSEDPPPFPSTPPTLFPLLGDLIVKWPTIMSLTADRTVNKCNIAVGLVCVCVPMFCLLYPLPLPPSGLLFCFFCLLHVRYSFHARLLPLEFTAILSTVQVVLSVPFNVFFM